MNKIEDLSENQLLFISRLNKEILSINKAVDNVKIINILKKVYFDFLNVEPVKLKMASGIVKIDSEIKFLLLELLKIEILSIKPNIYKSKASINLTILMIIDMFLLYEDELNKVN